MVQGQALGEPLGTVSQSPGELAEGADGVVGVQLVLAVDDLQGEEARGQVVQPQQGDAEAHRVHVTAQFGDLAGQRVKLLDALQDEAVNLPAALDVGERLAQAVAQPFQARGQGADLVGAPAQQGDHATAFVEQGDQIGGRNLNAIHLGEDTGERAITISRGDADAGGDQSRNLIRQRSTGEVHGVAVAQRLQFFEQGGLAGSCGLATRGAGSGRGGLDLSHTSVDSLDGVAQISSHGQGAYGQEAGARRHDRREDAVSAAIGRAVGDVGADGVSGCDVIPYTAVQPRRHIGVPHDVVSAPHQGAARVSGQAHEDRVGATYPAGGVSRGEEELIGGVGVLIARGVDSGLSGLSSLTSFSHMFSHMAPPVADVGLRRRRTAGAAAFDDGGGVVILPGSLLSAHGVSSRQAGPISSRSTTDLDAEPDRSRRSE